MEWILSIVGVPSAFLLHGYVGFIFGSIKANPLWGNVLMPIIFILSAIVSGIALCVFNYVILTWARRKIVEMPCLDTMAMFLSTRWWWTGPLKDWTCSIAAMRRRRGLR